MPDAPEENYQNYAFEVPPVKSDANREQKNWRDDKAPPKASEQGAVTVRADHSRQMVAHCAERSDENVNVLCAPARLRAETLAAETAACRRTESSRANC